MREEARPNEPELDIAAINLQSASLRGKPSRPQAHLRLTARENARDEGPKTEKKTCMERGEVGRGGVSAERRRLIQIGARHKTKMARVIALEELPQGPAANSVGNFSPEGAGLSGPRPPHSPLDAAHQFSSLSRCERAQLRAADSEAPYWCRVGAMCGGRTRH